MLFATANYSLTAIQREMAAAGLIGERSKKPLPISSIGNLLRNPFYYGVFLHKGELHQAVHVPMITKKTFDEIQAALVAVGNPLVPKKAELEQHIVALEKSKTNRLEPLRNFI